MLEWMTKLSVPKERKKIRIESIVKEKFPVEKEIKSVHVMR
jgi:hypothetical protein